MQQVINTKILTQLENLGKRLDSIEQNVASQRGSKVNSQKSKQRAASPTVALPPSHQVPQIPDLNTLCKESSVQFLVEQCLKQLPDAEKTGTKIKSLRGGRFVTYIGHYISTLYITYIRHYISALFNLSFMFIHCHKR